MKRRVPPYMAEARALKEKAEALVGSPAWLRACGYTRAGFVFAQALDRSSRMDARARKRREAEGRREQEWERGVS